MVRPAVFLGSVLLCGGQVGGSVPRRAPPAPLATIQRAALPIRFEPNRGKAHAAVEYLAFTGQYVVGFTSTGLTLLPDPAAARGDRAPTTPIPMPAPMARAASLQFVGANPRTRIGPEAALPGRSHYFIGADPARWHTDVPHFGRVQYHELYPGIDLTFYGQGGHLEFDAIVAPHADPGRLVMRVPSGWEPVLDPTSGAVRIGDSSVAFVLNAPRVYQTIAGERRLVAGHYTVRGRDIAFSVEAYDASQTLVIDPVLDFAATGPTWPDTLVSLDVTPEGHAIAAGTAGGNVLVQKLNAGGSALLYSVVIGGAKLDQAAAVRVAGADAWIAGSTSSPDFPRTADAFDPTCGPSGTCDQAYDAFLLKLDATGGLSYASFLGGGTTDLAHGLAIDSTGRVIVAGVTYSNDFPLVNALLLTPLSNGDAFITRFDPKLNALTYSTRFGSANYDSAQAVAVAPDGSLVFGGTTTGPSEQAFQTRRATAFVARIRPDGRLSYSSYLGGTGFESVSAVAADSAGNAHFVGTTTSPDFPVVAGAPSSKCGFDQQGFMTTVAPSGAFVRSGCLGGSESDSATDVRVDANGRVHVTGVTSSPEFPTVAPVQEALGTRLAMISTTGGVKWRPVTFLSGRRGAVRAVAIASDGTMYAATSPPSRLYKSLDEGLSWSAAGALPGDTRIERIVTDPRMPSTLYVTTGQSILKSMDAGLTWTVSFGPGLQVNTLVTNPSSADDTLFAGTGSGVHRSLDGGRTWTQSLYVRHGAYNLAIGKTNPATVYGVPLGFRTMDGGRTWSSVSGPASFERFAVDLTDASIVHAIGNSGLYKSTDGATTWKFLASRGGNGPSWGDLLPDPSTPSAVYLLGNGLGRMTNGRFVQLTAEPVSSLAIHPRRPDVLLTAGDVASNPSASDAFVTSFSATGERLFSTFLGGSGQDAGRNIAVDPAGDLYVLGTTSGGRFLTQEMVPAKSGATFIARLGKDLDGDGLADRDADGDGLPDMWERRAGLNETSASGTNGAAGDPDSDGLTNEQERRAGTHPNGTSARYFAEGAQTAFFDTELALFNPGAAAAHTLVRFLQDGGAPIGFWLTVPPGTRRTIDAPSVVGAAPAQFAAVVDSDTGLVAERTMRWDETGYGGHAETGASAPATDWYFAEGATHSGFNLFYLLQNPGDTPADVDMRYFRVTGAPIVRTYRVAPRSRVTIRVNDEARTLPALAETELAAHAHSTRPIVVERAMYLAAPGRPLSAGHASAGVTSPATQWLFAEGATGDYFDLFLLMANPTTQAADVEVRYQPADRAAIVKRYTVGAESRLTIWVDREDLALANTALSTVIRSLNGVAIVAERTMWWPGPTAATWREAHNSPGSIAAAARWGIARGEQGGAREASTYLLVANTGAINADVRVTLFFEDGTTMARTFPVGAFSRLTVDVGASFPDAPNKRFGAVVEGLVVGTPLVVDASVYSNASGITWAAGTSALATRLP